MQRLFCFYFDIKFSILKKKCYNNKMNLENNTGKILQKGFTIVEITIVCCIILLVAAIAIPNFVTARITATTNTCIANLKQINGAKQLYAIENGLLNDTLVSMPSLVPDYIKQTPKCPGGGTYVVGTPGNLSTCDQLNHTLS